MTENDKISIKNKKPAELKSLSFFDRYLSAWVILCIIAGVAIGKFVPLFPATLSRFEYAHVSIPVAVLIWLMIYPMMLKIDFASIVNATKKPKGLAVTTVTNWLIKPFTMYAIAFFFLKIVFAKFIPEALSTEYLAGAVLLGAAPCTAMVFVWSCYQEEPVEFRGYSLYDIGAYPEEPLSGKITWRVTMPWAVPEDDKEKEALERAKKLLSKLKKKYRKKDL